jgi:hypothetical protein
LDLPIQQSLQPIQFILVLVLLHSYLIHRSECSLSLCCGTNRELHEQHLSKMLPPELKVDYTCRLNIKTTVLAQVSSAPLLRRAMGLTYSKWPCFNTLRDQIKLKLIVSIHIPPDSAPPYCHLITKFSCKHANILQY